jgi:hypothetical protein
VFGGQWRAWARTVRLRNDLNPNRVQYVLIVIGGDTEPRRGRLLGGHGAERYCRGRIAGATRHMRDILVQLNLVLRILVITISSVQQ